MKKTILVFYIFLLTNNVFGGSILNVRILSHHPDTLHVEVQSSFNLGSPGNCPSIYSYDTTHNGNGTVSVKLYYDVSGIWGGNYCQSVDTLNLGLLPDSIMNVNFNMYSINFIDTNNIDTFDEKSTFSIRIPLLIQNYKTDKHLSIYPNPATHYFDIYTGNDIPDSIKIINNLGQPVFEIKPDKTVSKIGVEILPKGLYIVHIKFADKVSTSKIIVH